MSAPPADPNFLCKVWAWLPFELREIIADIYALRWSYSRAVVIKADRKYYSKHPDQLGVSNGTVDAFQNLPEQFRDNLKFIRSIYSECWLPACAWFTEQHDHLELTLLYLDVRLPSLPRKKHEGCEISFEAIRMIHPKFLENRAVMSLIVKRCGRYCNFMECITFGPFANDFEMCKLSVEHHSPSIQWFGDDIIADPALEPIAFAAMEKWVNSIFPSHRRTELMTSFNCLFFKISNADAVLQCRRFVKRSWKHLKNVPWPMLEAHPDIAKSAVESNWRALENKDATLFLRSDDEFMKTTVGRCWKALQYGSDAVRSDLGIARIALDQNWRAARYVKQCDATESLLARVRDENEAALWNERVYRWF